MSKQSDLVNITQGDADINGGTIDGTVIGGSTPAAISGTTGTFSGNLTVDTNTLFVDSANNRVGIGTTSPQARLHVANEQGGQTGRILFDANVTSGYETRIDATDVGLEFTAKSNSRGFAFNTGATPTERMRIDSSGNVLCGSDGGGDIGSSTKRFKDLYLSGGIVFGATGGSVTSKTLDDYEEGTWTVEAYDAPTGGNVSSSTNTGYYTKVGRIITASVVLNNIDTTGMTAGNFLYLTLPFACGIQTTGSVRLYANVADATVSLAVFATASAARVLINESRDDTVIGNVTIGDLTSGVSDVAFTITYQV